MRYSVPRKSRRVPLDVPVHLKLEELPDPVTQHLQNVSLGGVCVAIDRPSEVGSLVAFEFSIGDSLIEGTGEVTWTQPEPEGSGRSSAMGVRYRYLSPGSRERIFRLVQWYAAQKGDLSGDQVAEAASASLQPPTAPGRPPVVSNEPAASAAASPGAAPPADTGTVRMPTVASRPAPPAPPPAGEDAPPPLRGAAFSAAGGAARGPAPERGPLDLPSLPGAASRAAAPDPPAAEEPPFEVVDEPDDDDFAVRGAADELEIAAPTDLLDEDEGLPRVDPGPNPYGDLDPDLEGDPAAGDPPADAYSEIFPASGSPEGEEAGGDPDLFGEEAAYGDADLETPAAAALHEEADTGPRMARASDYTTSYSHLRSAEEGPATGSSRRGLWLLLAWLILVGLLVLGFLFRGSLGFGGDSADDPAVEETAGGSGAEAGRAGVEGDLIDEGAVDMGPAGEPMEGDLPASSEGDEAAPDGETFLDDDEGAAGEDEISAADGSEEAADEAAAAEEEPTPLRAAPQGTPATRVESITWNEQQGQTVVLIQGNGLLEATSISSLSPGTANAKLLIRIRGIREGYSPRAVSVGTPQLARIRTGLHTSGATSELHVVLDFAGAGVTLAGEVEAVGRELRAILTGP